MNAEKLEVLRLLKTYVQNDTEKPYKAETYRAERYLCVGLNNISMKHPHLTNVAMDLKTEINNAIETNTHRVFTLWLDQELKKAGFDLEFRQKWCYYRAELGNMCREAWVDRMIDNLTNDKE